MSTALVKRDEKGLWQAGTGSPNPRGMPPQTTAGVWRQLLREVTGFRGTEEETRAHELFRVAFDRAMDPERKDAVLWAKLIVERAEGPPREALSESLGLPEMLRDAHERWLQERTPEAPKEVATDAEHLPG